MLMLYINTLDSEAWNIYKTPVANIIDVFIDRNVIEMINLDTLIPSSLRLSLLSFFGRIERLCELWVFNTFQ